jgi:flagellar biosynthesis protein FlhA
MSKTAILPTTPTGTRPGELAMFGGLMGILAVLLAPLPPVLLDLLIALNLGLTIMMLLIILGVKQPLDFSVFPSILLISTLFRLALNVATTRLILLKGHAGSIVNAFGDFVVGGNLVVGLVIFLILVIIQFVVITRGAGRVSEVAARFTLDAMPGKQMAIDAELNSGAIDEQEARRRRQHLMREAEFHGAMDGASKFVRGDAIAGLIITAINLIAGVIMGLTKGSSLSEAIRTYSVLTIGDGLVAQVPAVLIALASGILVTKATSESSLGQEIGEQVTANPQMLGVGAMVLAGLAVIPGLPKLPFLALAGIAYWFTRPKPPKPVLEAPASGGEPSSAPGSPERPPLETVLDDFLQTDRACLEVSTALIPMVDPKRESGLIVRITGLRRDLAHRNGLWAPPIRIRDNGNLPPETYRFLVNGREVGRGQVRVGCWMAINPSGVLPRDLPGEEIPDPAFGLLAKWVAENDKGRAQLMGCTVVDAPSVVITHLGELLRRHAGELLGREDLKKLVEKARETSPSLVDEMIPQQLSMGALHRILTRYLEEQAPISNLPHILECLAHHLGSAKDPGELAERARSHMGRSLCDRFRDPSGRLQAIILDMRLMAKLKERLHEGKLALEPALLEKLVERLGQEFNKASAAGKDPALLTDTILRRPLWEALARALPHLGVLAFQEIPTDLAVETAAIVRLEEVP